MTPMVMLTQRLRMMIMGMAAATVTTTIMSANPRRRDRALPS